MGLHTRYAIDADVKKVFSSLHARALCHATEDLDKVEKALQTVVGGTALSVSKAEGHHGNPILIVEATIEDHPSITAFFERFAEPDLRHLTETLSSRLDDSCNIFVKVDKQSAFRGVTKLGSGDDVISVRIKIRAFPSRPDIAQSLVRDEIDQILSRKVQDVGLHGQVDSLL